MLIPFTEPYDLRATLCGGQAFRWRDEGNGWFCGIIFENIVRMRKVEDGIEFVSFPDSEGSLVEQVVDYLRLDDDLDEIYRALSEDEHLAEAVKQHSGLRLLRQEPWECLVSFICSANNNIPRITANVEDMAANYGKPLPHSETDVDDYRRNAFPTPTALYGAGEQALRDLKLGFRAPNVIGAAKAVATGELDLHELPDADHEYVLTALTDLRGVGDKIANCVMLFSLDKPRAFPVDVWITKAMRDWYPEAPVPPALNSKGNKNTPTDSQKMKLGMWAEERFGRYAGYANQYMFHHKRWLDGASG